MLQFIEQKANRFEKHEMQTLKNKKRPFRPIALSIYRAAIKHDQRVNDKQAERLAGAGLAPATSKKSRPRGGGRGWWAGCESNKTSRTSEPKATKAKNKERTRRAGAWSAERPARLANLRANIVPVIRTPIPFRPRAATRFSGAGVRRLY